MGTLALNQALVTEIPVINANQSKEEIAAELSLIMDEVKKAVKIVGTLQERIHNKVLIPAIIHAWRHRDPSVVKQVLNGLLPVKASVRIESMAFWFTDIAGIDVKYEESKGEFVARFVKDKTAVSKSNGHPYTYNVDHLNVCKQSNLRYWKVAPVKIIIPTLPESLDAAFDGIEKTLAKSLLVGHFSTEQIQMYIAEKLLRNAINYQADEKIKDWAVDYLDAHAPKTEQEETV